MYTRISKALRLLLAVSLIMLSLASCDGQGTSTSSDAQSADQTTTTGDTNSTGDASSTEGDTITSGTDTGTSGQASASKTNDKTPVSSTTTTKKSTTTKKPTTTNTDNFKGTTYYVSSSTGEDWAEGDSQSEPVKSLAVASTLGEPGDRVLFKRGDVWRGDILTTRDGVTYGAYSTGDAPKLYGSSQNYSVKGKWVQTSNSRVYYFDGAIDKDVGGVIFNNGSAYGDRKDSQSALLADRQYYYDHSAKRLFLCSRKGNPADVWSSIELNECFNLISLKGNNVTIQDLTVRYCDYGIVGGGNKNITIKNCDFAWIGGCLHSYSSTTRYGNAIELWGGVDGLTVDSCNFSQIFDTAITSQYSGNTKAVIRNVTISNNKVDKCHWSMEFWLDCKDSAGNYIGVIDGIKIINNKFTNAGGGWSANQRWGGGGLSSAAHIETFGNTHQIPTISDIVIKGNVFDTSAGALLGLRWNNYTPTLEGNTYIQGKGKSFGQINGKEGTWKFDDAVAGKIKKYDSTAKVEFSK